MNKILLIIMLIVISVFSFSRKPEGVIAIYNFGEVLDSEVDTAIVRYINQLKRLSGDPNYYPKDIKRQRYTVAYDLLLMNIFCRIGDSLKLKATKPEIDERFNIVMSGIFNDDSVGFVNALIQDGWGVEPYMENLRKVILSEKARKLFLNTQKVKYKEVEQYYNKNKKEFKSIERKISHILIADPDYDAPDRNLKTIETEYKEKGLAKKDLIEAVKKEKERREFFIDSLRSVINAGQNTFSNIARKFSDDPSAANGGNLGLIKKGQMVESFDKVAFALDSAEISFPIRTEFGLHLVKAHNSSKKSIAPIKEVEYRIRDIIRSKIEKEKIKKLLKSYGAKLFIYEPQR